MSRDGDDDDTVGYGKPPKKTRFQNGHSGNPTGRPKGSRNFDKDLDDVLGSKITVTENGRKKTGPVTVSCRPRCSFRPPFARRRQGFSSPVLSVGGVDCRSH